MTDQIVTHTEADPQQPTNQLAAVAALAGFADQFAGQTARLTVPDTLGQLLFEPARQLRVAGRIIDQALCLPNTDEDLGRLIAAAALAESALDDLYHQARELLAAHDTDPADAADLEAADRADGYNDDRSTERVSVDG